MTDGGSTLIERAHGLAATGQRDQALAMLETAAAKGDASALTALASWHMEGRFVPRSLSKSRDYFLRAGEAGSEVGRQIHIALVANGTGGARDWASALTLLGAFAETNDDAATEMALIAAMNLDSEGNPLVQPKREIVSSHPDIAWFRGLFSADECEFLIDQATKVMRPSLVVDPRSGGHIPNPIRTSDFAGFPWVSEGPAIHALNRRLAAASATDVEAGEPLQVLRYRPGQQYRSHHDAVDEANQRVVTMLVYLNSDYRGGETHFFDPGLDLRGAIGDALMFRNADQLGRPDPAAQHAGLPVQSGEKFIASRWIRNERFGPDRSI